jgi:SAM-dependent methyltransferase
MSWADETGRCACGHAVPTAAGIIRYTAPEQLRDLAEPLARDRQAGGYTAHAKFPTQIARLAAFLDRTAPSRHRDVYELGCGPGPYTPMLAARGHHVLAVDFSGGSLAINRSTVDAAGHLDRAAFVQADLRGLRIAPESCDALLICDVLQHVTRAEDRRALLQKAFSWLRPGGRFYVSFFNFSIQSRLRGDRTGAFGGVIPYERLRPRDVMTMLPAGVRVETARPMNVFHSVLADTIASRVPGAGLIARMIALTGSKS